MVSDSVGYDKEGQPMADFDDEADDADEDDDGGSKLAGSITEMVDAMESTAAAAEFVEYDVWESSASEASPDKNKKKRKKKAKLQVQKILDAKVMWRKLRIIHPPLSFTKPQWDSSLRDLRKRQETVWTRRLSDI